VSQLVEEEQQRLDPLPQAPLPADLQQRARAAVRAAGGAALALPEDFYTVGIPVMAVLLACCGVAARQCFLWTYDSSGGHGAGGEMRPLRLEPTRKFTYVEAPRTFEVRREDLGAGHVVMRQVEAGVRRQGQQEEEDEQVL